MKCPKCWAEKAWIREVQGVKRLAFKAFCVVPLRCHHCYHKFHVSWFSTIGQRVTPPSATPELRVYPASVDLTPREPSHATGTDELRRHAA